MLSRTFPCLQYSIARHQRLFITVSAKTPCTLRMFSWNGSRSYITISALAFA